VNEPVDLTLILGVAVPDVTDTAVKRIIEEVVARLFVTVVLLPVTETVPKELGLRPEEVAPVPSHEGGLKDILHRFMF
tara:strand:+ start:2814 stop:3047 length:234 start_codon:yes stop_codon:yes gene_type:complete